MLFSEVYVTMSYLVVCSNIPITVFETSRIGLTKIANFFKQRNFISPRRLRGWANDCGVLRLTNK